MKVSFQNILRRTSVIFLLFLTALFVMSCKHKDDPAPPPLADKDMTVIVYIAAENSLYKYCNSDINEMVRAAEKIPLNCNFVVYLDNLSTPVIYTIDAQQGKSVFNNLPEQDSCNPEVFRNTIKSIISDFPAERYGLVMWSHGSGWIPTPKRSIGVDNNMNDDTNKGSELEIPEMRRVLEQLGVHWNYIMFDACLMQSVETAYELRHLTDFVIASPAEIPGRGAPYELIMPYLIGYDLNTAYNYTPDLQAKGIVDTYFDYYKSNIGLLISAVKTSEMENLLHVTRELCPNYYDLAPSFSTDDIQVYCTFHQSTVWKPEFYDMGSTMHKMLSAADYEKWKAQYELTVPFRQNTLFWYSDYTKLGLDPTVTDPDHVALMSIFIPNAKYDYFTDYNEKIKKTQWYKDFCNLNN